MTEEFDPKKLGDQCFAMGHYLEAAEAYQLHCNAHPDDGATRLQLGTALLRSGEETKGLDTYAEAAMVFARLKQVAKAIAATKLILEYAPEDTRAKQLLVDICSLTDAGEVVSEEPPARSPPRMVVAQPVAATISPPPPRPPPRGYHSWVLRGPTCRHRPLCSCLPRGRFRRPRSRPSAQRRGRFSRLQFPEQASPLRLRTLPRRGQTRCSRCRCDRRPCLHRRGRRCRLARFLPPERKPLNFPRIGVGPAEPGKGVSLNLDLPTPTVPVDRQDPANALLGNEVGTDSWLQQIEIAAGALPREQNFDVTADLPDRSFEALTKLTLFSDLPPDLFVALSQECAFRIYAYGERIIEQGSVGDSFFVVVQGKAHVVRKEGNDTIELAILDEGEFFGEMALISGSPRNASVYAYSDETQLLEFSGETLKKLAVDHPSLAGVIRKFCRQRLLSNLLKVSPLLSPFDTEERRWLIQRFRSRDLKPGEVVVPSLDRCDGLYVLLYGECVVRVEERVLSLLKEGESFDRRLFLEAGLKDASVIATKSASILRLPQSDYDELQQRHPGLSTSVTKTTPPS